MGFIVSISILVVEIEIEFQNADCLVDLLS